MAFKTKKKSIVGASFQMAGQGLKELNPKKNSGTVSKSFDMIGQGLSMTFGNKKRKK